MSLFTYNESGTTAKRPTKRAPDAGDCPEGVRKSQAVSYALSFFWLDGSAVPAPAQVTQSVSPSLATMNQEKKYNEIVGKP